MTTTLRFRNPQGLQIPEIQDLFNKAFKSAMVPSLRHVIEEAIENESMGVFLTRTDDYQWVGLAAVHLPRWDDAPANVLHFYCRDRRKESRESLVEAVVTFAKDNGVSRLLSWDINRKPRAFEKLFQSAGPVKEVTRAYEFDLTEAKY